MARGCYGEAKIIRGYRFVIRRVISGLSVINIFNSKKQG